MAFKIITNSGKEVTLLNPSEKGKRFAEQLSTKIIKETNTPLSEADEAYRKGYLAARRDSADAYNAKHNPAKLRENKEKRAAYRKNKK